ncbi:MAG TPA: sigma-70 family RNA polymerase sigma factor [Candidatus Dormibacteraeota bacterium]|nr:sigma-70 family RNA polymerase sigma factor [Candidatus Dormibacteraeota bacterium]
MADGPVAWTRSDEVLLAGLGSGDPEAAAAFVDRFQRRVFGMTLSILRDREAAEEAAQEAFVQAWRQASAYDARRGGVAAWLLSIARNVSIDVLPYHRSEAVGPEVLLGGHRAEASPDGEGWPAADTEPVREALLPLPEEQRRALVLAVLHGYTAREMGELEGIPVGTAKIRIRIALMKLRAELRGEP